MLAATLASSAMTRLDLLGLTRAEIFEQLADLLDRPFRADQIHQAIYRQGARRFDEMTTLGVELRRRLGERCVIGLPAVVDERRSDDGTRKVLFALADGATVEAVEIPSRWGTTLCLSSQAGCALGCTFCVTGYWGAGRDLSAGEVLGQVLGISGRLPYGTERLNIVLMGMGEPLHNLDKVRAALELLAEAISWRHMTLSTVGVVDGIRRLAEWPKRPNLAVSLHAPDDERRSRIMPINRTHGLDELFATLSDYPLERGRRITFEYLMIDGFNDAEGDAAALAARVRPLPSKVNLIPINPDPVLGERMAPPPAPRVEAFARRLRDLGVTTTVRRRRGDDVSAACGQLCAPGREPRGFRRSNLSF
jgi:23S rRNA (adenine2503-C2)-methyltransferase